EPPNELQHEKAIEIVQLYADLKMIGKGVGAALMEAALDVGRAEGMDWVWLGVWEENHRAIAFYRKWGFERFGEHVFFVGLDAQTDWWMKKKL
ncbi:MAG: GNAT family N-acetyltransferase, partial [Bacteroidetes bacterium]|nr:GNAT family N-acetyltransferase [Bacteroidota bacterium]